MKTIYRASFSIGTVENKPSPDEILTVINEWVNRRINFNLDFSQLKEETKIDSEDASLSVVKLSREETSLVSLALKHDDRNEKDFKWSTEIHLKDQEDQPHKISIAVSNGWSGTAIRPELDYRVSRPSVVPMLVDALECYNFKHLKTQPEILTKEKVSNFVSTLYSKRRSLPIVLITHNSEARRPTVDAVEIARNIVGLAHVYVCEDKLVPFTLEKSIGKSMSCYDGSVRIYWPIHRGTHPSFHPTITHQALKEQNGLRARNIPFELLEKFAKESLSSVAEVSPEEIQEMRLRIKVDNLTEQREYRELAELYSQENSRLNNETEQLKKTESELRSKIYTLESRLSGMQTALDNSKGKDEDERLTNTVFKSVKDAIDSIQEMYSDNIVILGRAQNGAKDCIYDSPETVFKALEWLATTYIYTRARELKEDLARSAMTQTGLHYIPHQSEVTMSRFENEYFADYEGKKIPLKEHLRKGTSKDPRHTLSIAFHYDSIKKKVIIGFIGQHQTTKTT